MYRLADNGNRVAKIKVVFESKIRIEQRKYAPKTIHYRKASLSSSKRYKFCMKN